MGSTNKGAIISSVAYDVDETNIGANGDVDGTFIGQVGGNLDNSTNYNDSSTNDNSIVYNDNSSVDNRINYDDHSSVDNSIEYSDSSDNSVRTDNSIVYTDSSTTNSTVNYSYTETDHGAVDRAFDFADGALENLQGFGSLAFSGLTDAYDRSLNSLAGAVGAVSTATSNQIGALANANRSETAASFDKLVKYGLIAVAVIGVAIVITRKG